MIKAIKNVSSDVLIGTRASFNILISKYAKTHITKIGMEHMNFDAHLSNIKEIIAAYRNLNKVTTLTESDQKNINLDLKLLYTSYQIW